MIHRTQEHNNFLIWVRKISVENSDIIEYMRKSMDPLDRAIAARIIKLVSGDGSLD